MNKRASIFITAFIIAIAIAIFMLMNSTSETVPATNDFELPDHYAEATASFIYQSLEDSETIATYDMGTDGLMDIDNGYWISYSVVNPPSVDEVKELLSEDITTIMNEYIQSLDQQEISGITVTSNDAEVTGVTVNVDDDDVFSGMHDDFFDVTAQSTGSIVFEKIDGQDSTSFQESSFNVPIDNWRFWYLFRKMTTWVLENEATTRACQVQPQYGIRGNARDCMYGPITIETAKDIFDEEVQKLEDSFDKDGICVFHCADPDPDCDFAYDGPDGCLGDDTCNPTCETDPDCPTDPVEDGYCIPDAGDPDCAQCNADDPYVECSWELICGEDSVWSEHEGKEFPCGSEDNYLGEPNACPGTCVDGCEYINNVESCYSGTCEDTNCPLPDSPDYEDLVPPCMENTEIEYTGGEYTGEYGTQVPMGTCYGVGTKYKWSLIAEVTCEDTKNRKPISVLGFQTLPMKIRIHQYFEERYHEPYVNPCHHSQECVIGPGGASAGGEPDTGETGGGGESTPTPPPPPGGA